MSAQLLQILAQLDREGATEVVIASGRQIAVRVNGAYQTLTANAVTMPQLLHLIRSTPLAAQAPTVVGVSDPEQLEIGGRPVRVQMIRNGADLMVRIEPSKPGAAVSPAAAPTVPGRAGRASTRPKSKSVAPRAKTPSKSQPAIATDDILTLAPHDERPPVHAPARPIVHAHPVTPSGPAPADPVPRSSLATTSTGGLIDEPCQITPGLAALVRDARKRAATDLHVAANRPVMIRTVGELVPFDPTPRAAADVEAMLLPLLGPVRRRQLDQRGYVDLAVEVPGAGRLRGNVSRQQGGLKGAFRLMLPEPPTLEQLGLPPQLAKVTDHHQGLVVIAGPSGHGKTTTLAALVDLLNRADPIHILTIEDPVEIEHPRKAAVISQREVGRHTLSFAAALKASLREDPDVIVIGELRDRETVEIALTAAETGHLVLATMSTPSAAKTIDRLIDMFPPDEQSQVRASLAGALRAIVAQRLVPSIKGDAVIAVIELVVGVLPLATLIRDNKLFQLPNLMQRGKSLGMIRLDDSLADHVRAGRLSEEAALKIADSRKELAATLHPEAAAATAAPAAKPRLGGLFGKKE